MRTSRPDYDSATSCGREFPSDERPAIPAELPEARAVWHALERWSSLLLEALPSFRRQPGMAVTCAVSASPTERPGPVRSVVLPAPLARGDDVSRVRAALTCRPPPLWSAHLARDARLDGRTPMPGNIHFDGAPTQTTSRSAPSMTPTCALTPRTIGKP